MADPYAVLGIPRNATDEQLKDAYRALARKYQEDSLASGPLADVARRKMEELDRAYDAIVAERRGQTAYTSDQSSYANAGGYNAYGGSAYSGSQFADVRAQINSGRIDDAEMVLEGIPIG